MTNIKQRDFDSEAFSLRPTGDGTCRMLWDGKPESKVVVAARGRSDANDKAAAALAQLLTVTPDAGVSALRKALGGRGHRKGTDWMRAALTKLKGNGVRLVEAAV